MTCRAIAGTSLLVALGVLAASPLLAHLAVSKTAPANGATLEKAPGQVQVWFTQPPSERVSQLELHGPGGAISLGEVQVNRDERTISAAVPASLDPGGYEVRWRTAGNDGHVMRGTFSFSVKSKP